MNKKVVFFAVHPDDETLGCGGTILKHKAEGDEIYWVIVTSIVDDTRFSPELQQKRKTFVNRVAEQYGFNDVWEMKFHPTQLDEQGTGQLILKFGEVLDAIRPDIIYSMFCHDVHTDHQVAFTALYSSVKSFRRPYIKCILMAEVLSETDFAVPHPSSTFIPNVFVDITEYMKKKLEIMQLYDTEVMDYPLPRSLSSIEALARVRGSRAGVEFAESFMLLYKKW